MPGSTLIPPTNFINIFETFILLVVRRMTEKISIEEFGMVSIAGKILVMCQ